MDAQIWTFMRYLLSEYASSEIKPVTKNYLQWMEVQLICLYSPCVRRGNSGNHAN